MDTSPRPKKSIESSTQITFAGLFFIIFYISSVVISKRRDEVVINLVRGNHLSSMLIMWFVYFFRTRRDFQGAQNYTAFQVQLQLRHQWYCHYSAYLASILQCIHQQDLFTTFKWGPSSWL